MRFRRFLAAAAMGVVVQGCITLPAHAEPSEAPPEAVETATPGPTEESPQVTALPTPQPEETTAPPTATFEPHPVTDPPPDPTTEPPDPPVTTTVPPWTPPATTPPTTAPAPSSSCCTPTRTWTSTAAVSPSPSTSRRVVAVVPGKTLKGRPVTRQPQAPLTPATVKVSKAADWTDGVGGFGQDTGHRSWLPVILALLGFGLLAVVVILIAFVMYRRRTLAERDNVWGDHYYG